MESKDIIDILKCFDQSKLVYLKFMGKGSELILEKDSVNIDCSEISSTVENSSTPNIYIDNPMEAMEAVQEEDMMTICSSSVGIMSLSDRLKKGLCQVPVKKGDILCVVEAMKIYNNITAPEDGIVTEVFIDNSSMVEYKEKIMNIRVKSNG